MKPVLLLPYRGTREKSQDFVLRLFTGYSHTHSFLLFAGATVINNAFGSKRCLENVYLAYECNTIFQSWKIPHLNHGRFTIMIVIIVEFLRFEKRN